MERCGGIPSSDGLVEGVEGDGDLRALIFRLRLMFTVRNVDTSHKITVHIVWL